MLILDKRLGDDAGREKIYTANGISNDETTNRLAAFCNLKPSRSGDNYQLG